MSMKWIPWALLISSMGGFLDSMYLTIQHYTGGDIGCSITHGCDEVLTSQYASVAGVPTALFGVLYYFFIVVLMIIYLETKKENVLKIASLTTIIGLIVTIMLVYLQAFVIEAWCQYCLLSATTSTLLFVFGMIALRSKNIFINQKNRNTV